MQPNDTPTLDVTTLDQRVTDAIALARTTPGMRVTLHNLPETYVLDWARRHGNAPVQVNDKGISGLEDAFCSVIAEQTTSYGVVLIAAPGQHAELTALARLTDDVAA